MLSFLRPNTSQYVCYSIIRQSVLCTTYIQASSVLLPMPLWRHCAVALDQDRLLVAGGEQVQTPAGDPLIHR